MPDYRRLDAPGASIFFTVVTLGRRPILTTPASIGWLRAAFRQEMDHHPFAIDGIVILPDHLHALWTLPPDDSRYSMRWTKIKGEFTTKFLEGGGVEALRNESRIKRGERGVWQRRFWDHVVRDDDEYGAFMDYIHWNPVKPATRAARMRGRIRAFTNGYARGGTRRIGCAIAAASRRGRRISTGSGNS